MLCVFQHYVKQLALSCDDPRIFAIAARGNADACVVLANPTQESVPLTLSVNADVSECLLTANGDNEAHVTLPDTLLPESILVIKLKP